jgi:hypothetical protein
MKVTGFEQLVPVNVHIEDYVEFRVARNVWREHLSRIKIGLPDHSVYGHW